VAKGIDLRWEISRLQSEQERRLSRLAPISRLAGRLRSQDMPCRGRGRLGRRINGRLLMGIKVEGICKLLEVFDMPTSVAFYRDVLGFDIA